MQGFTPGTVLLERYRLTSALGRGRMGQVWQGRDLRLERPVAVKTVAADLLAVPRSRDGALQRFRREAKASARLVVETYGRHDFLDDSGQVRPLTRPTRRSRSTTASAKLTRASATPLACLLGPRSLTVCAS